LKRDFDEQAREDDLRCQYHQSMTQRITNITRTKNQGEQYHPNTVFNFEGRMVDKLQYMG